MKLVFVNVIDKLRCYKKLLSKLLMAENIFDANHFNSCQYTVLVGLIPGCAVEIPIDTLRNDCDTMRELRHSNKFRSSLIAISS